MVPVISDILKRIDNGKAEFGITLYKGASAGEIAAFEKYMNVKLPDDVRKFYSFCNGFESEEDWFRIIPLDEIFQRGPDDYTPAIMDFPIAEYMTYCDMWSITIDRGNSNNYSIYRKGDKLVTLTNSFPHFLEKFLEGGVFEGLYTWEEDIGKGA